MESFHNDPKIKRKYLSRIKTHQKLDEIAKGYYWENGKGCAIGCTIHSSEHGKYEEELGIPEWLARLEDVIFEGLPNKRAKEWPHEFLKAVPVGKDLSKIEAPFVIFILEGNLDNFDAERYPDIKRATLECIRLYRIGDLNQSAAWNAAESAAWSAAWSAAENAAWSAAESAAWNAARSAAWSAAWSAAESAAWNAARSAARNAAWSAAESAAESAARNAAENAAENAARSAAESAAENAARSAAESAAWSAAESAAWSAAWSAAESAAYVKYADKLLELLKGCK